jgi:hypothetical protein
MACSAPTEATFVPLQDSYGLLEAVSTRLAVARGSCSGMRSLEHPQVAIQLVASRVIANRPTGPDLDGPRANAIDDALRATQKLDEVLDQLRAVEVNRCHCRRRAPGVAAAEAHLSFGQISGPSIASGGAG